MPKLSKQAQADHAFAKVFNDVKQFPSLAAVGKKLGLTLAQVKDEATAVRRRRKQALAAKKPAAPALIYRTNPPLSEDSGKYREDYSAEDCLKELRKIAEAHPDQVISRNFFRVHSAISESTWNRYFGTFEEFKRQAGIKLSRAQHGMERKIAKHASVDNYRAISAERRDWADKYVRDSAGRFKTAVFCSDLHDKEIDPFYLRVLVDTIKRCQPDVVSFVGDVFDLPEFGKYGVDPREWDVVGRIKFAHENIFAPIRTAAPKAQLDFIEGNHEARLLRQLADATPALKAVLSDLHGMTISKLLGLEQFEINYYAKADLAAWTERDFKNELRHNHKIYWNAVMANHFPDARHMGMPGVNGHHHSHVVWPMFNPIYGAYEWHQMGCGHRRDASYCNGEKWHMGFDIVTVDTKTRLTVHDYVSVTDFAVSGGKFYYREPAEVVSGGLLLSA